MKTLRQIGSLAFVIGLFTAVFAGIPWYLTVADDPVIPWWLRIAVYGLLGGILIVLLSLSLEQKKYNLPTEVIQDDKASSRIMLLNSLEVPGREITDILGTVQGHTIYAIWLGKDLSALIRLVLGGELTEYTEMMGNARRLAMNRMLAQAEELGADAVINLRYTTTSIIGSAAELFAYGTAIKLNK
jgi:uncharacterized protein YbjQ (UPF0145 family)